MGKKSNEEIKGQHWAEFDSEARVRLDDLLRQAAAAAGAEGGAVIASLDLAATVEGGGSWNGNSKIESDVYVAPNRIFPRVEGVTTVLGPDVFANESGDLINWAGRNFVPQEEDAAVKSDAPVDSINQLDGVIEFLQSNVVGCGEFRKCPHDHEIAVALAGSLRQFVEGDELLLDGTAPLTWDEFMTRVLTPIGESLKGFIAEHKEQPVALVLVVAELPGDVLSPLSNVVGVPTYVLVSHSIPQRDVAFALFGSQQ